MRLHQLWILPFVHSHALATSYKAVEELHRIPEGWAKIGEPDPAAMMRFQIAVEHNNQEQFEQTLLQVSDPFHELYGKHLSREELKAMLRPKEDSTNNVTTWLEEGGASNIEDDGELINFSCTMHQAEKLMSTKFSIFKHRETGTQTTRALRYSVPKPVRPHIRMIHPTIRFGRPKAQVSNAGRFRPVAHEAEIPAASQIPGASLNITFCNSTVTPECLRALYSVGDYKAVPNVGSKMGITGYLNEVPKFADLKTFLDKHAPYATGSNFSLISVNGGPRSQVRNSSFDDVEANLDTQYTIPFGFGQEHIFYSTAGLGPWQADVNFPKVENDGNEPYLDWLNYMAKIPTGQLPQTITTSYGEDEQVVPEAYTRQVCDMLGQLGARGVSIIFSSGDTGPGTGCVANFGNMTGQQRFLANFPGTCPWVTTVGGTVFVAPEAATNLSTGGFSERFSRPSYQKDIIPAFLPTIPKKFANLYNPDGRAVPDVAVQAQAFAIFATNPRTDPRKPGVVKEGVVGGTSASAPVFAALVGLMNNARLANNMTTMGFLNPWIYGPGKEAFTDITTGKSLGCGPRSTYSNASVKAIPDAGWDAVPGWDAVTGFGTPIFKKMLELSVPGAAEKHLAAGGNFGVSTPAKAA